MQYFSPNQVFGEEEIPNPFIGSNSSGSEEAPALDEDAKALEEMFGSFALVNKIRFKNPHINILERSPTRSVFKIKNQTTSALELKQKVQNIVSQAPQRKPNFNLFP